MKSVRLEKRIGLLFLVLFLMISSVYAQVSYQEAFPNISFNFPVEIQHANDGSNRLFVVEQPGTIRVFPNNSSVSSSDVKDFLDIESQVSYSAGQEIGLLGLAFHPNFSSNRFIYVYYIDRPSNYRVNVVRYQVSASDNDIVDTSTETIIFQAEKNQNNSNHNGGKIAFGPDGYLYISIGDGGGGGDPQGNGQNLNTVFGSILRIDIDVNGNNPVENNPDVPNGNYEIPSDNPRVGQSGLDELYAWGIRNTWKFSFDGTIMYGADVGQENEEEINIIELGNNYGWNRFEGNTTEDSSTSLITSPDTRPILTYDHSNGDVSITGGYVYKGSSSDPSLIDKYIYGDYVSGRVWALDYNETTGATSSEFLFRTNGQNISSFGEDEAGELYFSDYGSSAKLYKITGNDPEPTTVTVNGVGSWLNAGINAVDGIVETIANDGTDTFYVGGLFSSVSGTAVSNIATYSKALGWAAFGTGTNGKISSIAIASNGNIYVGGDFSSIDGTAVQNIAFWNGSIWNDMNGGTNGPVSKIIVDSSNNVYVGGAFETAGGNTVNNIAIWSGGNWSALADSANSVVGTNNEIRSLAFDESDNLYVGGNFDTAGGNNASRIAVWNGTNWSALGEGTSGFVQAILVRSDYIYAGGNFSLAGSETVNRIARWNRATSAWEPLNNGLSGSVNSLAHDNTYLYVGGSFETASDNTDVNEIMNNVARYSESSGWEALGKNTSVGVEIAINALSFSANNLSMFAGGNFTEAGEINAKNIAVWNLSQECVNTIITPEYEINGSLDSGENEISISEGSSFSLGTVQDVFFQITLPNATVVNGTHAIASISFDNEGTYTFTTTEGCTETFILNVTVNPNGDEDNDGVINSNDTCPNTASGETVDANGCGDSQRDDDDDGVSNAEDICPNTPSGEDVDLNGCGDSQLDDDNDGVFNNLDLCPNTPNGASVNSDGCGDSQLDDDNDGVSNAEDTCANTPNGENVNSNGCSDSQLDDDNDGVSNADDICPNTPAGDLVDTLGCGTSEQDIDNDGVVNTSDLCNNTPNGEPVDDNGCSASQLDDDNDGVSNENDVCPNTPDGETVNENGCSSTQLDDDNDGVSNADDICPNTATGETVDNFGCSAGQQDIDDDGVNNDNDLCNDTPLGATVNENGCSESQLDDDGDGVNNSDDNCPNTPIGTSVTADGCEITSLPIDQFAITSNGNSCITTSNGKINIVAKSTGIYTAELTTLNESNSFEFTDTLEIEELVAGEYELCIMAQEYSNYENCSKIIITAPQPLIVQSSINNEIELNSVTLKMSGGAVYSISVNDKTIETEDREITLALTKDINTIRVSSERSCQGVYEEIIALENAIIAYPNPAKDFVSIDLRNIASEIVRITIYAESGAQLSSSSFSTAEGTVTLKTSHLTKGIYFIRVKNDVMDKSLKLIKL
ncbi:PQQ-dependent sugar dehydrogenase [Maribacter sp. R77961]|uniref:PQQ-dependent sugar dehydrogenase n=1 Tax=Maribacter sp. R77961 TaxID=3093871 RepID=UPI0037CAAA59